MSIQRQHKICWVTDSFFKWKPQRTVYISFSHLFFTVINTHYNIASSPPRTGTKAIKICNEGGYIFAAVSPLQLQLQCYCFPIWFAVLSADKIAFRGSAQLDKRSAAAFCLPQEKKTKKNTQTAHAASGSCSHPSLHRFFDFFCLFLLKKISFTRLFFLFSPMW